MHRLFLIFYLWPLPILASVVDISPPYDFSPRVQLQPIVDFAIQDVGLNLQIEAQYYHPILIWIEQNSPAYEYVYTLHSGPAGATLSPAGNFQWIPPEGMEEDTVLINFTVEASLEGEPLLSQNFQHTITVFPSFPQLSEDNMPLFVEEGTRSMSYEVPWPGLSSSRKFLDWSLVDPPLGVRISTEGELEWDFAHSQNLASISMELQIVASVDTGNGLLSSETVRRVYRLPQMASYAGDLIETSLNERGDYATLGFAMDAEGVWLAASEPYLNAAFPGGTSNQSGRIRLWKQEGDGWDTAGMVTPMDGKLGQSFGASLALATASDGTTRLVGGAPEYRFNELTTTRNCGAVYLYEHDAGWPGGWRPLQQFLPEPLDHDLYFGGWVDLDGRWIVVSAEGEDHYGAYSGALYIYEQSADTDRWTLHQKVLNPDGQAGSGSYFSYPCAVQGDWIVAAANEDSQLADRAGAVHLYKYNGSNWEHHQKLFAPEPTAGALFGEQVHLAGDWLFIGAPRTSSGLGAVYVYRLLEGFFQFQQRLIPTVSHVESFFGASIDLSGETLIVGAPTAMPDSVPTYLPEVFAPSVHRFHLQDGTRWQWTGLHREPVYSGQRASGWGARVALLDQSTVVFAQPFASYDGYSVDYELCGFLHPKRWEQPTPELYTDLEFDTSEHASPEGDANGDGTANLLEWMWGYDPEQTLSGVITERFDRSVIFELDSSQRSYFLIPEIKRTAGLDFQIMASTDLIDWEVVEGAQWAPVATERIPYTQILSDNFVRQDLDPITEIQTWHSMPMHRIRLPETGDTKQFYRLEVTAP